MVTWGANTVHTIGSVQGSTSTAPAQTTAAPTSGLFGSTNTSTAPSPGGFSFGSSITGSQPSTTNNSAGSGLFGSTTSSAPNTGGLFGSNTPAPAPGGGLFGQSTTTTTSGGLFGSTSSSFGAPAPSSSGGLFGSSNNNTSSIFGGATNTGSSLFGNNTMNTGGLFGSPSPFAQQQQQQQMLQQQQQQKPQIPAHAALQAHMNAYARNEEARVLQRMQSIYQTYTGTTIATEDKSHCFSIPLYNPITEQQRQLQNAVSSIVMTTNDQGFMVSTQLTAPPKPLQISDKDWNLACIRNPDSNQFLPTAVVGAESLQARAILHQEQTNIINKHIMKIQEAIEHIQQRHNEVQRSIEMAMEYHTKQCTRLLKVMKAVEIARCFNLPLQSAELDAFQQMKHIKRIIIEQELIPIITELNENNNEKNTTGNNASNSNTTNTLRLTNGTASNNNNNNSDSTETIPYEKQQVWMSIMKEHRKQISKMTETIEKEHHDLQLIYDRVIHKTSGSTK